MIKYRTYKVAINIMYYRYEQNSKIYEIKEGKNTILPGLKYSLLTLFFGFWGGIKGFVTATNALSINFRGGEDLTKSITNDNYEDRTLWIYNNLLRSTSEKLTIDKLDSILDLQYEYEGNASQMYDDFNKDFIINYLNKIGVHNINKSDIQDIFDTIKHFDKE